MNLIPVPGIEILRPRLLFGPIAIKLFVRAAFDFKLLSCSIVAGNPDAGFVAVDG